MASDVRIDRTGLDNLLQSAAVQTALDSLCDDILEDARAKIVEKGAVQTRALLRSGRHELAEDGPGRLVGFDIVYAHVVHDGLGRGRNDPPRPFLAEAALRHRGRLDDGVSA